MGSLCLFEENVEAIKEQFNQAIKHHYLQSYVNKVEVDDDKIRFLYAMLHNKIERSDLDLLILSTLLVQAGLDIHDEVTLQDEHTDQLRKRRQLTVLAGDYYVALYYHLLAKNGNVPLIQKISHTIQQINETKMNHYEQENVSMKQLESIVDIVETGLMQQLALHFDEKKWQLFMKDYFYLKKLVNEKESWLMGNETAFIRTIKKEYTRNRVEFILNNKIDEIKDRILHLTESWTSMKLFVIWHLDQLNFYDSLENIAEGE